MKIPFLILIIVFSAVLVQSASAYHEERERIEMSQMTGIFSENMRIVLYPIIDKQYHLQVVLRENNQPENSTMNVGYGFNLVEKTPHRYSLDESPQEIKSHTKARHILQSGDSKTIQTGQYDFPIIINFTATFEEPGFYNYRYFENQADGGGRSSSSGTHHVVSGYSKAIDDDGCVRMPHFPHWQSMTFPR